MNFDFGEYKVEAEEGFTLLELLVSIVIVGVLSAIALPSFFNQAAKARSGEGKVGVGAINRAQVVYHLEFSSVTADLNELDAKLSGKFYTYSMSGSGGTYAAVVATTSINDIKAYSGAVVEDTIAGRNIIKGIICETDSFVSLGNGAAVPAAATNLSCPLNTAEVN